MTHEPDGLVICPDCENNENLEGYPDMNCKTCKGNGYIMGEKSEEIKRGIKEGKE